MADKKARVLSKITVDGNEYQPNQIISGSATTIKNLEDSGLVDSNRAAVKHCLENEGAKVTEPAPGKED